MIGSKLPWRIVLGLALLVAVSGCTNTFQGAQRDVDNLLANRRTAGDVASSSAASADKRAADEWVDPR
jgi:predicted small secreted protein